MLTVKVYASYAKLAMKPMSISLLAGVRVGQVVRVDYQFSTGPVCPVLHSLTILVLVYSPCAGLHDLSVCLAKLPARRRVVPLLKAVLEKKKSPNNTPRCAIAV
jgi:hypothetical protein